MPMPSSNHRGLTHHVTRQFEERRYLTAAEKRAILDEWLEYKQTFMRRCGHKGGRGFVDPEIVPLCDALNQLDGVCTLQSCAGHAFDERGGLINPGRLWLWLDRDMARSFERRAHQLAAVPEVDRVGKIYWKDGKETVTIDFKGDEAGLLAESSSAILDFFRNLCG